jgi:Recombination endonuclease VII
METRQCSTCQTTKSLDDFYFDATGPLGRARQCKQCAKARSRAYRIAHPEKHREQERRRRTRRAPHIAEQKAKWYAANVEHARAVNKENTKRRNKQFPERRHDIYLKSVYGVPYGTYAQLLAAQEGRCAICGTTEPGRKTKRFHLDHCHDTGEIRGLLCAGCNVGIAHLQHSEEILISALRYLGY